VAQFADITEREKGEGAGGKCQFVFFTNGRDPDSLVIFWSHAGECVGGFGARRGDGGARPAAVSAPRGV
jgi:hypothetical protein